MGLGVKIGGLKVVIRPTVIELRLQRQALREVTCAEQIEGLRAGDFIDISNNKHIISLRGLRARQAGKDLCEQGVALEVFHAPRCFRAEGLRILDLVVDDFRAVAGKLGEVLLQCQWFAEAGEGLCALEEHGVVD